MEVAAQSGTNDIETLDLERFFAPASVAILGASETEGSPGAGITRFMLKWAAQADDPAMYLVNPNRETIAGLPVYKTLDDVPVPVDLCVVIVNDVLPAVEAAVRNQSRYVIVFSSGFAESGEEGRQEPSGPGAVAAGYRHAALRAQHHAQRL